MPTEERVRGVTVEVAETVRQLGFRPIEVQGPIEYEEKLKFAENTDDEDKIAHGYYLIIESSESTFYIAFTTAWEFAQIKYPFNIANSISRQLEKEEVANILDEKIDWESLNDEEQNAKYREAGETIIINTKPEDIWGATFNLSIYASSSVVRYEADLAENGIPIAFQCTRAMFPYTEVMSIKELDDRIDPVIAAGERGKRYVEMGFGINKQLAPEDYTLQVLM